MQYFNFLFHPTAKTCSLTNETLVIVSDPQALPKGFEVDGWVVKVGGQSMDILFKTCLP